MRLTPHIAEELWSRLGHAESLAFEAFPVADPALFADETVTCVVQVKGKVRARLEVPTDITEDAMRELALAEPRVIEETPPGRRWPYRPRRPLPRRRTSPASEL